MLLTGYTSQENRSYTAPEQHNRTDPVDRRAGDLSPRNLHERCSLTTQIPYVGVGT